MNQIAICEHRVGVGRILRVALMATCVMTTTSVLAQSEATPSTKPALPDAESIIEKGIEATGGRDAYKKIKSRIMKGKLEMAAMNMQGTIEMYQARPGKMYTITNMQGMGKSEEGVNGDVAWQNHPMMGIRIKEGAEKTMSLRSADFDFGLNWRDHYTKVETVEKVELEGKPAYVVKMTPPEGPVETRYYDAESGLHVKTDLEIDSPMGGKMPMEMLLADYKDAGGIKVAARMTQRVMGQEVVVSFDEIKHNEDIPDDKFALPQEVKDLMKEPATP